MNRIAVALTCLLCSSLCWGLRLTPIEEVAQRPASAGPLDRAGLIELSLVLSGAPRSALQAYTARLDQWSAEFRALPEATLAPEARGDALLTFLHRHLSRYQTLQTRVDVLLDQGTYNCVSSALAYMILGRDFGLDVQGVATTDHAFALVRLEGGKTVDVETTTPHGFDPGTKVGFKNSFGQTGFAYVPPGNYARRRTVSDRQLLGLLIQNRWVELSRRGQSEDEVGLGIDRWTLEGSPEAFKALIDGFVNYASTLNELKDYQKGLELVDAMVAWTGPVDDAKKLALVLVNNHVNLLLDRKDWAGAQALTRAWANRGFLTEAQATQTTTTIVNQQVGAAVDDFPPSEAARLVESAYDTGMVTAGRRQELLSYAYGKEVQRLANSQGPRQAYLYINTLPAQVRSLPALVQSRQVYAYNWSVEVHNHFAQLWNQGQKEAAKKLLQDTLDQLPESALLKKDQVLIQ